MIKPSVKPKYEVEFKTVRRSHKYVTGAMMYDSVTKILNVINKPALVPWASRESAKNIRLALKARLKGKDSARINLNQNWIDDVIEEGRKAPDAIRDEAARIGTMLHDVFFDILNGKNPKVDKKYEGAVDAFNRYMAGSGIIIDGAEFPVASNKYEFGGMPDALAYTTTPNGNKSWGILDWKTSKGVYDDMGLQVAGGYKLAVEEQYGIEIEWCKIVRFAKVEPFGFEVVPITNMEVCEKAFLSALDLYKLKKEKVLGEAEVSSFEDGSHVKPKKVKTKKIKTGSMGF